MSATGIPVVDWAPVFDEELPAEDGSGLFDSGGEGTGVVVDLDPTVS